MFSNSRCQMGALVASQSFAERMNSRANLLVTKTRTRLDHDLIDMLVVLQMNKDFMMFTRKHKQEQASWLCLIFMSRIFKFRSQTCTQTYVFLQKSRCRRAPSLPGQACSGNPFPQSPWLGHPKLRLQNCLQKSVLYKLFINRLDPAYIFLNV